MINKTHTKLFLVIICCFVRKLQSVTVVLLKVNLEPF